MEAFLAIIPATVCYPIPILHEDHELFLYRYLTFAHKKGAELLFYLAFNIIHVYTTNSVTESQKGMCLEFLQKLVMEFFSFYKSTIL